MQLLSQINIQRSQGDAIIQLLQGDLSAIPAEYATDILAMSSFPGDYTALEGSLIKSFGDRGLNIGQLALDKDVDLLSQLNCWLSKPLPAKEQQKFNFKRVLCFEPGEKIKAPEEVVGDIFRCINTFVFDDDNNELAMPIIATGYQMVPVQAILPALLQAAVFWLKNGLPLKSLKLVVYNDDKAREALYLFEGFKNKLFEVTKESPQAPPSFSKKKGNVATKLVVKNAPPAPAPNVATKKGYDYFLSYAHVHSKEIEYFVNELKNKNKDLLVFYDKDSIPPGGLWIQQISSAIQQANKVLVFLSPDYDNSPVCWDEFQCAKLVEYNRKKSIIQTVYLHGHKETEMPLIMGIYSYIDCREGSTEKMDACLDQLLR